MFPLSTSPKKALVLSGRGRAHFTFFYPSSLPVQCYNHTIDQEITLLGSIYLGMKLSAGTHHETVSQNARWLGGMLFRHCQGNTHYFLPGPLGINNVASSHWLGTRAIEVRGLLTDPAKIDQIRQSFSCEEKAVNFLFCSVA